MPRITVNLRLCFPVLLLCAFPSMAADTVVTNWSEANCGPFSIKIPPGMTNVPVRGIDSLVGRYVSSNIVLTFDYGWYSGGSSKGHTWPGCTLVDVTIDGRKAEILSYGVGPDYPDEKGKTNILQISFDNLGKDGRDGLGMKAYCLSEPDRPIARRILESIRFKYEQWKRSGSTDTDTSGQRLRAALTNSAATPNQAQQEATSKLKEKWKREVEKYRTLLDKSDFYLVQVQMLRITLKERTTKSSEEDVFQRINGAVVPQFSGDYTNLDNNYDNVLLQAFVERSMEKNDTPRLIELLTHNCPRYIVFSPLEFSLAHSGIGIEPLLESYTASSSPLAKEDIAFCLGRAFPALRIRFPADDEFVKQARAWYLANRTMLKLNDRYQYLPAQPAPMPGEDTTNLFVLKVK